MTSRQRLTYAGIAAAIAVVAIVVILATGGGSDANTTTRGVTKVVVRNGAPVGGVKKIEVKRGQRVRFTVTSDVADEVHVHLYDFHKDVSEGGTVSFDFPADKATGVSEVELENAKLQLISLRVDP